MSHVLFAWPTDTAVWAQIDEILITLPYGFVHLVEKPTDLQLMNEAPILAVHSDK